MTIVEIESIQILIEYASNPFNKRYVLEDTAVYRGPF